MSERVTKLETKIYRVKLNIHEMRHVQKKYLAIRQSLLDDSVHFNSTLDKLEEQLMKQLVEINHLKEVKSDAVERREVTKSSLGKLESAVIAATSERAVHIQQLRRMVEERKTQLERVERGLLPSTDHDDYRETKAKSIEQFESPEKEEMDLKFEKLKTVTGAKNPEEVLLKFQTQRDTKERLTELKQTTERDKKELEMRKMSMEAELESYKFAQVKEKERSAEEIEKIRQDIADKLEEEKKAKLELDEFRNKLKFIQDIFVELCKELMFVDTSEIPETKPSNIDELIQAFQKKLSVLLDIKEKKFIQFEHGKDEKLDSSGIMDALLDGKKSKKIQREGGGDVPTRAYLKRQSQLYVEAMTRRKGYQQKLASLERKQP